jgi:hypothetical protein
MERTGNGVAGGVAEVRTGQSGGEVLRVRLKVALRPRDVGLL